MPFRTYDQAKQFLATVTDYERQSGGRYSTRAYNLARFRRFLKALGNPHEKILAIHVAGTKGKGSTCHILESILRAHGLKTGLYTSPHLVDMLERIRVGGVPVSRARFVAVLNRMRRAIDRIKPTYFEIMTAAAFVLFERVKVAVIEVGMGGRLDATNVIAPELCVITRIDLDHMDKLGRTLAKIAAEKAGIIKPRTPVFTTETKPEPLKVIQDRAQEMEAHLAEIVPTDVKAVDFVTFTWRGRRWALDALGAHQAENAAVALAAAIRFMGWLDPAKADHALRSVDLPARLQRIGDWIVDAAHTPLSMKATADAIASIKPKRLICIFGCAQDKDHAAMMKLLSPDLWILTQAKSPRSTPPEEFAPRGAAVRAPDVASAVALAHELKKPGDRVLVTGSFYVAGEALVSLRSAVR